MPDATPRSGLKSLLTLRDELNKAIDEFAASNEPLVALDDLSQPAAASFATPPVRQIVATGKEIVTLVHGQGGLFELGFMYHLPGTLRVAIEAHVVETLKAAASNGKEALHVDEIAKSSNIDPKKLGRILRLLASYHIFREVDLDVFANNRNSLFLDTGKAVDELKATDDFYSGTNGIAALIAHVADDSMKGAACLAEIVLHEETASSYSASKTAVTHAINHNGPIWDFYAQPGNERLMSRFASAMKAAGVVQGQGGQSLLNGFPFPSLAKGSTIVDVGSGVGAVSLELADAFPDLNFILQDRSEVIKGPAQALWQDKEPNDLESGRIKLMPHDYFEPQPVKDAELYLMRFIIHDLPDADARKVLAQLAAAAGPSSRLLLIEQTYDELPACEGPMTSFPYIMDMQMLVALNSQERTVEQYRHLARGAGWELVKAWKAAPEGQHAMLKHYEFRLAKA